MSSRSDRYQNVFKRHPEDCVEIVLFFLVVKGADGGGVTQTSDALGLTRSLSKRKHRVLNLHLLQTPSSLKVFFMRH